MNATRIHLIIIIIIAVNKHRAVHSFQKINDNKCKQTILYLMLFIYTYINCYFSKCTDSKLLYIFSILFRTFALNGSLIHNRPFSFVQIYLRRTGKSFGGSTLLFIFAFLALFVNVLAQISFFEIVCCFSNTYRSACYNYTICGEQWNAVEYFFKLLDDDHSNWNWGGKLTAAVLGATGAVGKEVLAHLVKRSDWGKVIVVNRRHIDYKSSKIEQHIVDMETETLKKSCTAVFKGADALFITMGVGAASKVNEEVLRKVDVDLPTACSEGAADAGVKHVSILTAIGANANAKAGTTLFGILPKTRAGGGLYNQCKGKVEKNIGALPFPAGVSAFRPAALIGTPHTPKVISMISPFLDKVLPTVYRSSRINTLAGAMVLEAENRLASGDAGTRILEGKALHQLYKDIPFEHGNLHSDEL